MGYKPEATEALEKALAHFRGELTVADAAAKAALPLRQAEEGLRYLAAEYGGHIAATTKGELIYAFPQGLQRRIDGRLIRRVARTVGTVALSAGRFLLRAWVSVVLLGYSIAFLALIIVWAAKSEEDPPSRTLSIVLRVIGEAVYWTFHPFSPFDPFGEPRWMRYRHRRGGPDVPLYEKVNGLVFGPTMRGRDPNEEKRRVLADIRRQKGRVGPADVMRTTGATREEADALLLRLLVDYDGDIEVTESGAIVYRFSSLRTTVGDQGCTDASLPVWNHRVYVAPLTGNSAEANAFFLALNAFSLAASAYALLDGLTIERVNHLLTYMNEHRPPPVPAVHGVPLVLGLIPFVFSLALFVVPLLRVFRRPFERRRVIRENGWRGLLQLLLTELRSSAWFTREQVVRAWSATAGREPTEKELDTAIRNAGGELELTEQGELTYRFELLERERRSLQEQRRAAPDEEAWAGRVVFSSADPGAGFRDEAERADFDERIDAAMRMGAERKRLDDSDSAGPVDACVVPSATRPHARGRA